MMLTPFLAAALACPFAQAPRAGQPPASGAPSAQMSGTVRSAVDDRPIARARVTAASDALEEPRAVVTNNDGTYLFTDLPAGAYTVSATRTGYAPQTYGQGRSVSGTPVTLTAAQRATNVDFALAAGGVIVGRILDEDGSPFAGAVVEALITRFDAGTDTLFSVASAQTDDRGEFRLYGLAPGRYYVSALDPAFRSVSSPKGVMHYSPTYYPGTSFADQAKTIAVTGAGDAPHAEFRIRLVPPARVGGQLMAYDGKPLLSGAVIMSPLEGEGVPMVPPGDISIQPDGRFVFGQVVPGRYQIRARAQTDPAGGALFAVFPADVLGTDVDGIQMVLRPGAVLDGRLLTESRRGAKPPVMTQLRVRAPFTDGNGFGDALTGTVQPDGTYALRGIMAGAHQIVVEGLPPPWVLERVSMRGADITDLELTVHEHEQLHDVRITISDAGGVVTGIVRNARDLPAANVGVLVFSKVPLFWKRTNRRMRMAYTDDAGRFTVPGLPAGEYLAVASAAVDESDLGRRERLQALQAIAVPFRLASDDARAVLTLQVPPPASAPIVR